MDEQELRIKDSTSNPAPLGLLGFGMTTILLNLHNAGFYGLNSMVIGMGIFMGGLAQIIAGIQEWKKNNTFGATAFTSYGLFWLALVALWLLPSINGLYVNTPNSLAVGWFLLFWGLFTSGMFIGALKLSRALQVVFASLAILFFLLAAGDFTGSKVITTIAGFEGIFCGLSAFYICLGLVINEVHGKKILPLG
jgi:uncharacterized protein